VAHRGTELASGCERGGLTELIERWRLRGEGAQALNEPIIIIIADDRLSAHPVALVVLAHLTLKALSAPVKPIRGERGELSAHRGSLDYMRSEGRE
jgi:hypothetical protein